MIAPADVERLLDLGKGTVFVQEEGSVEVHEDEAAMTVAPAVAGPGVSHDAETYEGKVSFRAEHAGVLRIDTERLLAINSLGVPALPTLPANFPVNAGQTVAAFRISGWDAEQAAEELSRGVFAIVEADTEADLIRASVGAWNRETELDRFLERVAEIAGHTPETLPRRPSLTVISGPIDPEEAE